MYNQDSDLKPENFMSKDNINSCREYVNYLDQDGKKHYLFIEKILDDGKKLDSALKDESIEISKGFIVSALDGKLEPQVIIKLVFRNTSLIFTVNANNKLNSGTLDLRTVQNT
ncbi:Hypothetical protein HVR_LOCUS939 [uncultured virus]|nr:Hypothetical protein HVR_LOCUS939 [uncultured virus]